MDGVGAYPVLLADRKWSDDLLREVVDHRNVPVVQKDAEELFLIDAVLEAVEGGALGWQFLYFRFCPREEIVNPWL